MAGLTLRTIPFHELHDHLDALARLRIKVFRDFPYLYDGDLSYERNYLKAYAENPDAYVAGAFDGDTLVGACTASPLTRHHEEFAKPFAEAGLDLGSYFYFGESVLMSQYRGQGAGVAFFEMREAEARRQAFSKCLFCAVRRPDDHPQRPVDYQPLDKFWSKRGYRKMNGTETTYAWKDIDEEEETQKPMDFWVRDLDDASSTAM